MKIFTSASILGFLFVSTTPIYAADQQNHSVETTPFYFGVDAAYIRTKDNSRQFKDALTDQFGSTPSVKEDRNGGAGRVFAGYTFNQNISLELAYFKTSTFKTDVTDNAVGYTASLKTEAKGVELAALFSPSQLPNFFVKAGAVYSKVDARIRATGTTVATDSIDENGMGYVVGFGYKYPVNELLDIKATYAYYGRIAGESDLDLNMLSLGMQYHF